MIIRGSTIGFRSHPVFFEKEKAGSKNNTVRVLSKEDLEFIRCRVGPWEKWQGCINRIQIENAETSEFFTRQLIDISYYDDRFIFTWKHEPPKELFKTDILACGCVVLHSGKLGVIHETCRLHDVRED